VFGTALNYVSLRLLGVSPDHPVTVKARATLHRLGSSGFIHTFSKALTCFVVGGANGIPAWGKFWLSVLNVYEWEGQHPIPAYMWLLPDWLPFHPHRWWIHTRNVYIPMSYMYTIRFKGPLNDLIRSLRQVCGHYRASRRVLNAALQEIYTQPYESINWLAQRNNVCSVDLFAPHSPVLNALYAVLGVLDPLIVAIPGVKDASLAFVYNLVKMEDENTGYQTLGPVSKMLNQLVRYIVDGPDSHAMKMHTIKRQDFMWLGREGLMMTGTNGSQLWDIAFITQGFVESGLATDPTPEVRESLTKALGWLDEAQMQEDPLHYEAAYRHTTKGAWPFSTKEQGYTVSDCVGEGLKSVIFLQDHLTYASTSQHPKDVLLIRSCRYTPKLVSESRMCDAVDVILSMQNPGGAFASYELIRGPKWLEKLNPAEVFGDIMTEFPYPECTTSAITALATFRKHNPTYRSADIEYVLDTTHS
jgi:lanosterol synthase